MGWRVLNAAALLVVAVIPVSCEDASAPASAEEMRMERLERLMSRLVPLHRILGQPKAGDWLAEHEEPGQTFRQYTASSPVVPDARRNTVYVMPLGDFERPERRILDLAVEFLGLYFACPCRAGTAIPLSEIPESARRVHPAWGDRQVLTTYVLDEILKPRLPGDAVACIAITTADLWPGRGWNFVFGQASIRERVGVWSIYRYGDPAAGEEAFRRCLGRTLKTATHETGHMFSMLHCTAYECNMCGSNSLEEADRQPLWLCPECAAKVCWMAQCDPEERFRNLEEFCRRNGLTEAAEYYGGAARAVSR
ncbi:MAG: hypothetical protein JW909_00990 [Planctomycetes bacterium]|nr:hypothetical protein [Planctomycetota bacterium]